MSETSDDYESLGKNEHSRGPVIRRKRDEVRIWVGLDFGTSSTKLVYNQIGTRPFKAINFNHDLPNYPNCCLPSLGAFDDQGKLLLGVDAARFLADKTWDQGLQRFKVIVAGDYDESFRDDRTTERFYDYCSKCNTREALTAERLTAVYLAHIMHTARQIIQNEYIDVDVQLTFNIGMPIDHVENSGARVGFEKIFAWAEVIEDEWRKMGESRFDLLSASYRWEGQTRGTETRVFAVPESVAQIASYLVSLRKQEGLHAVLDFGAGTTDVSIFNLKSFAGEDTSYWYAARNIPRGTARIERMVAPYLTAIKGSEYSWADIFQYMQSLGLLPKGSPVCDKIKEELTDLRMSPQYSKTWAFAYKHLKKQTLWERVEVFACGGGANLPHIRDVFSIPWWDNIGTRYKVGDLPAPDNYVSGESLAPFSRMAVAYGLAIPKPQLTNYVLPNDTGDHTPPPLPVFDLGYETVEV